MPELPEVEITARRLHTASREPTSSRLATGVATLKTFTPPLDDLAGMRAAGTRGAEDARGGLRQPDSAAPIAGSACLFT
jgi:hypothetical protein